MSKIRPPYVAGQFYNANPKDLLLEIEYYLNQAQSRTDTRFFIPQILIVPHAGYTFSGPIAAYAYKTLLGKKIKRVFLLGNSHKAYFDGVAVDNSDYWQTPLGELAVDLRTVNELNNLSDNIFINSETHLEDHVIEVQLPFLQVVLDSNFKIIPMVFGNSDGENYYELGKNLINIWEKGDLLVVSSDLSHYPSYEDANKIDKRSLELIISKDIIALEDYINDIRMQNIPNEETLMCGVDGIKTAMTLAENFNWKGEVLKYANSGDSSLGEKDRVVGYGAVVFRE